MQREIHSDSSHREISGWSGEYRDLEVGRLKHKRKEGEQR